MQYGKLVNGRLFKAPFSLTDNGCNYGSPPDDVYRKYGYKPVERTSPIEDIPYGKTIKMSWTETDDKILQSWEIVALEDDYAERLRKAKGHFNLTMVSLKQCIDEYNHSKNAEAETALNSSPILKSAYDSLCAQFPDQTFVKIMDTYRKSIPFDFFESIKFKDDLINMGYSLNGNDSQFISLDPYTIYTSSDMKDFQNRSGRVYHEKTGKQIFIIPEYAAFKILDSDNIEIIEPMMFCFALKHIAELFESSYAPCTQFTMGLIYLHTILDEFINGLMSFYIHSFPKGCDLSNSLKANDILTATDLSSLQEEIISKTINDFGYKGYREKIEYLKKRGITSSLPEEIWLDDMIWFCERRNAVVHNSGIINTVICDRLAKTKYESTVHVSDDIRPSYQTFCDDYELIQSVGDSLYETVKLKFNL